MVAFVYVTCRMWSIGCPIVYGEKFEHNCYNTVVALLYMECTLILYLARELDVANWLASCSRRKLSATGITVVQLILHSMNYIIFTAKYNKSYTSFMYKLYNNSLHKTCNMYRIVYTKIEL